jgi:asparagine synthase (glutamine-hydrolysing)
MCGIFGILARKARVDPLMLQRATQSLAHRGPDDSGTVIVRDAAPDPVEIGLGSRRLAILDLSPMGHQPMEDEESGNWIAYNGEIYNFLEIREKLRSAGVRFRGQSDTEVLLKAYRCWGESCIAQIRGMFAFAIWDAQRHRLMVARDPMGIKPLYYYSSGQYLLFASELRTLLGTGLVPRQLDHAGLISYLSFGSIYEPSTLIEGVRLLGPGHYLTWENGSLRDVAYWGFKPQIEPPSEAQRSELQEEVYAALDESVRMQMVSDVPVGVFLSGGIDSSSLAGILSHGGSKISTFSLVFREADYSEAEHSRAVAQQFGTDHHELMVSQQDALSAIPGTILAMDQPTMDGFNTYLVSQHTRAAGIKVALSGLGGDELFCGYSSFRTVPRMERFSEFWHHVPALVRRPLANAFALLAPDTDQNRKLSDLARANGNLLHPYFLSRMLFTPEQRQELLASADPESQAQADAPLAENLSCTATLDPINRVSYLESRCYMLNTLLRDSDVMSMAHGLEIRVPLIDHCLAEKLLALPGVWKMNAHTPKPLLTGALRGALPDHIVHRRKRGFTLPFEHWLRGELRPEIDTVLGRVAAGPLVTVLSPAAVAKVWKDFQRGATSWSRPWSLYVLQRWCELHSIVA